MPESDQIARVLIELQRTGQLGAVLAVIRDDYHKIRRDLDVVLLTKLLCDEASRAEVIALQGMAKGVHALYHRLVTLSHAPQVPLDSAAPIGTGTG